ncbi:MAG: putative bifunctional diguanylate cyclase/phosphodiesterase, partial [Ilumatobacteraceae bacterium]
QRKGRLVVALARIPVQTLVLTYAAALVGAATAAALLFPSVGNRSAIEDFWWTLGLVAVFALSEANALHIEFRRQTHSLSLSSIPLTICLLYFEIGTVVVAFVLGAAVALRLVRRSNWLKTTWNLSMFSAQTGVAAGVLLVGIGRSAPGSTLDWAWVVVAVLAAEAFSSVAVALVIWIADRQASAEALAPIVPQMGISLIAGCFAAIAAAEASTDAGMVVFGVIPLVGFFVFLKASERTRQREQDLTKLQTFTVSEQMGAGTLLAESALREIVQIMRSERSLLLLGGRRGATATMRVVTESDSYEVDASELIAPVMDALVDRTVSIISADDPRIEIRRTATRLGVRRALAAPVLVGDGAIGGVVLVGDRLGMRSDYSHDEIQLFVSLARTLDSRLANTVLSEEMRITVSRDALTGLANRASFEQHLDEIGVLPAAERAVMWIDIRGFGEINEMLGPETGDEILGAVARRIEAVARPTDFVARVGGDEFAVVLDCEGSSGVGRAKWIHGSLNRKIDVEGLSFELRVCGGLVPLGSNSLRPEEVMRRAAVAMQGAKRSSSGFLEFVEDRDGDQGRRAELYLSVPRAFDRGEFTIALQPKVSTVDGRVTGAEVLARWTHPTLGPISPSEFIPLILQTGTTSRLTRLMIERAAEAITRLADSGNPMTISVNVTARDLLDPTLPSVVFESLRRFGAKPEMLKVELTEDSAVVDFTTTVRTLERLSEFGVSASLDDFGTGYASLGHLHQLPVQELKVDRSFVERLPVDPRAAAVVRAAVSLAEAMNMTTVAEGVEDVEMLRLVRSLGVTEIQGFLVSRPIPLDEFVAWVVAWQGRPILDWLALCEADSSQRSLDL